MTDTRRLFDAMDRRDHAAIFDTLFTHLNPSLRERGAALCRGCAHPAHAPTPCLTVPLIGRDRECRCPGKMP
jgi:hypothetical protein